MLKNIVIATLLINFSAVMAIGDFLVVAEEDII